MHLSTTLPRYEDEEEQQEVRKNREKKVSLNTVMKTSNKLKQKRHFLRRGHTLSNLYKA